MLNTLRKLNEEQASKNALTEQFYPDDTDGDREVSGYEIGPFGTPERTRQNKGDFTPSDGTTSSEAPKDDVTVINDVEVKLQSNDQADMKLSEEQKTAISGIIDTFKQQVSQTANLDPGFSINPSQIRFDGEISEMDLRFTYVAGQDTGLYVNSEMSGVTPEFIEILTKMARFDQMYRDAMDPLITQRQNN